MRFGKAFSKLSIGKRQKPGILEPSLSTNRKSKKAQERKYKILEPSLSTNRKSKKAQEEMVGFGVIVVIVTVILMVLLVLTINDEPERTRSFKAESFLGSLLGTTTECYRGLEFRTFNDVVSDCVTNEECSDGRNACDVMEEVAENSLEIGWSSGEDVRGYSFEITSEEDRIMMVEEGNLTGDFKGATERLSDFEIVFEVYDD